MNCQINLPKPIVLFTKMSLIIYKKFWGVGSYIPGSPQCSPKQSTGDIFLNSSSLETQFSSWCCHSHLQLFPFEIFLSGTPMLISAHLSQIPPFKVHQSAMPGPLKKVRCFPQIDVINFLNTHNFVSGTYIFSPLLNNCNSSGLLHFLLLDGMLSAINLNCFITSSDNRHLLHVWGANRGLIHFSFTLLMEATYLQVLSMLNRKKKKAGNSSFHSIFFCP